MIDAGIEFLNTSVLGLAIAEDLGVALTQFGDGLLKVQDGNALLAGLLQSENLTVLPLDSLGQIADLALKISDGGTLLVRIDWPQYSASGLMPVALAWALGIISWKGETSSEMALSSSDI